MSGFPSIQTNALPNAIAAMLNRVNRGKFNATVDITLAANAASTTVTDERLTTTCALILDPMTANAAAAAAGCYVTAANRGNGTCVITHANTATTDRTFRLLIIG